ncbi:MAG: ATP-binding protein [Acidobacteria bacterium]|nr:ATP-binding protein [Acidobacteriota bacterium]
MYVNLPFESIRLLVSLLYLPFSFLYWLLGYPYGGAVLLLSIIPLGIIVHRAHAVRKFVDTQFSETVGDLSQFSVYTRSLPGYRFVDIFNATAKFARQSGAIQFESQHAEQLTDIIAGEFYQPQNRFQRFPEHRSRAIDSKEDVYLPIDCFWLVPDSSNNGCGVFRVRTMEYTNEVQIEVAAISSDAANSAIATILEIASAESIYKNKTISVSFEPEVRDEFGSVEVRERIDPIFISQPEVTESDIIIDEDTETVVKRTILDFHERRSRLSDLGLPTRRGVLFYGPPGTGKTYMSRYISDRLKDATTIVSSGQSLLHMRSVCNLARMLQPSIIVLEDVDLVYSSREINFNNTALGELMNELDGFNPDDAIIFILTTNSIERVEAAIKERPGRISQCVYFGPPTADLRKRYLTSLLKDYDIKSLKLDAVVDKTDGTTQAFLKEMVFRAVQIASETDTAESPGSLKLTNSHLDAAMTEMRKSAGNAGEAIIGFSAKRFADSIG